VTDRLQTSGILGDDVASVIVDARASGSRLNSLRSVSSQRSVDHVTSLSVERGSSSARNAATPVHKASSRLGEELSAKNVSANSASSPVSFICDADAAET